MKKLKLYNIMQIIALVDSENLYVTIRFYLKHKNIFLWQKWFFIYLSP